MKKLPDKELLRPQEVGEFWGVSRSTIYRWIDEGIIPARKLGKTIRVLNSDALKGKKTTDAD